MALFALAVREILQAGSASDDVDLCFNQRSVFVSLNLISLLACLCYASERYRELQVCSGSKSDSRTQRFRAAADVGWIYLFYLFIYIYFLKTLVKAAGVCCLGGRLSCKVLWETL